MKGLSRALFIFLAAAIVIAVGFIVYLNVVPQKVNKFTEFYILNANGEAYDYPQQATVGAPVYIVLGVVNHEYSSARYKIDMKMEGVEVGGADVGTLADRQKWEEKVSFIPQVAGEKQSVDFFLYKDGGSEPYLKDPLSLQLSVIPK